MTTIPENDLTTEKANIDLHSEIQNNDSPAEKDFEVVAKQLSTAIWKKIVDEVEELRGAIGKSPLFEFTWENVSAGKSNGAMISFKDDAKPILEISGLQESRTRNDTLNLQSVISCKAANTTRIGPRFMTNKTIYKSKNIIIFFDLDDETLSLCTQAVPSLINIGGKARLSLDFAQQIIMGNYPKPGNTRSGRAFRADLKLASKESENYPLFTNWKKLFMAERSKVFGRNDNGDNLFFDGIFPDNFQEYIEKACSCIKNDPEEAVNILLGNSNDAPNDVRHLNIRKLTIRILWLLAAKWINLLGAYGYPDEREDVPNIPNFIPSNEDLRVLRPVSLKPHEVYDLLSSGSGSEPTIHMPYAVIVSACAALNAGKHLILTGPPGNGKTTLAKRLAQYAKRGDRDPKAGTSPLLSVTASPAWTTSEMIGRYLPDPTPGSNGLEFVPGFYQEAVESNKWLLIDEFNRADMDQCFGELFTVLSGQSVTLPFKRIRSDNDDQSSDEALIAVTLPEPPDDFRIIATMNDADAGQLNTLSFALRRRFVILNIDVPDADARKQIFAGQLTKHKLNDDRINPFFKISQNSQQNDVKILRDHIRKLISLDKTSLFVPLFQAENSNLLDLRVIGIAQATDMIDFIVESLRDPEAKSEDLMESANSVLDLGDYDLSDLIASYAAMAASLLIFPQLDACDDDRLMEALRILCNAFTDNAGNSRNFILINRAKPEEYKVELGKRKTISAYLRIELLRQFKLDSDRCGLIEDIFASDK